MGGEVAEWDRCRKFFESAIHPETGGHTAEDYAIGVMAGYFQLWPGERAAAVTGTSYLPDGGECVNVLLGGGDYDELMWIFDAIETRARAGGAVGMMVLGRAGWRRAARERGLEHIASVFYKRLEQR